MTIIFGTPEANRLIQPELKPCPFCGKTNTLEVMQGDSMDTFVIYCNGCAIEGPEGETLAFAIADWNARPNEVTP